MGDGVRGDDSSSQSVRCCNGGSDKTSMQWCSVQWRGVVCAQWGCQGGVARLDSVDG